MRPTLLAGLLTPDNRQLFGRKEASWRNITETGEEGMGQLGGDGPAGG